MRDGLRETLTRKPRVRPPKSWPWSSMLCLLVIAGACAGVAVLATGVSPVAAGDEDPVLQPHTGAPVTGLSDDELDRFEDGRVAFQRVFEVEDGLGPIFNKDSCGGCHSAGGTGGSGSITVIRFGLIGKDDSFDPLAELGGSLRQSEAISDDCAEVVPVDANVEIERVTNSTFGAGLVEAIPDADIEALESDEGDITGRVHWVQPLEDPDGDLRVGRFGWKAQVATVLSFSGDAALNEMGITNRLVTEENAPNGDPDVLADCDEVEDPEDDPDEGPAFIDEITDFQRFLAAPPQTPRSGMTGEDVFIDIGCADCHVAEPFTTGEVDEEALSGVEIKPYSDFLLHDMGSLGDLIEQGDAGLTEFRTPSLWGLRVRNPLLHDGRVNTDKFDERIDAAILAHAGEAEGSVDAYELLSKDDHAALLDFLDSLGRAEFDHDGDQDVDENDFPELLTCSQIDVMITPDDPCAISDIDANGLIDIQDFEYFLEAFEGDLEDCNENDVADLEELFLGEVEDTNGNLIPDECEIDESVTFVRGDSNTDGEVELDDALHILNVLFREFGKLGCQDAADVNDTGRVDLADGIFLLRYLFIEGSEPRAPFPDCDVDPRRDELDCAVPPACL